MIPRPRLRFVKKGDSAMNELRRELEILKRQCKDDPGIRAGWIMIGILLGPCVIGCLLMLPFIL